MATFESPLTNPASWNYTHLSMELPEGARYAGYKIRGLNCTIAAPTAVSVPMRSAVRKIQPDPVGPCWVELQFSPFLNRAIANELDGGVPTMYLKFADGTGIASIDNSFSQEGILINTVTEVSIGIAFEDRIVRDPVYWVKMILDAMVATAEPAASWDGFRGAVTSALGGNSAPVMLLNGAGQPMTGGTVEIDYGGGPATVFTATLVTGDGGNLQAAIARLNGIDPVAMPITDLFSTASTFILRPVVLGSPEFQMARIEDGTKGVNMIAVTANERHIQFINLNDWFAPQFATPTGAGSPALPRFTRGNKISTFINGREFFDELFRELHDATGAGNGIHHVGWAIVEDGDLIEVEDSDPADQPYTVRLAFSRISGNDGKVCVLPAKFIQLNPDAPVADTIAVVMLVHLIVLTTFLILASFEVSFARTEPAGFVLLISTVVAIPIAIAVLFDSGGNFIEQNKGIIDAIGSMPNANGVLSAYPATVADNQRATPGDFPFSTLFQFSDKFGVYHQKFSVVKKPSGFIGYCGGIDLNTDRLDDEFHLARNPFHDTHMRFEGPAVRDIALSFEERWQQEGRPGSELAFTAPSAATLGTPGDNIVQIARTYFLSTQPARAFNFAPSGDRTILDTLKKAMQAAKEFIYIEDQYFTPPDEYLDILISKVTNQEIKKLILVVPEATDQPFGDISRKNAYQQLKAADPSGKIVMAGFPRRGYTVSANDIRANSGKLILNADTADDPGLGFYDVIELGPAPRCPSPPFFLSIEGEIMYAYQAEGLPPGSEVDRDAYRSFRVLRGESVPGVKTKPKKHKAGAAATVITQSAIYIHSKTMIVDDVFLSLGSANVNRRGFYHDGEMQSFTIPETLRTSRENPIAAFRKLLWSDMLNIPRSLASTILSDPVAASKLFTRSTAQGNRFVDLAVQPGILVQGFEAEDNIILKVLQTLGVLITGPFSNYDKFFRGVVDPTTGLEPAP